VQSNNISSEFWEFFRSHSRRSDLSHSLWCEYCAVGTTSFKASRFPANSRNKNWAYQPSPKVASTQFSLMPTIFIFSARHSTQIITLQSFFRWRKAFFQFHFLCLAFALWSGRWIAGRFFLVGKAESCFSPWFSEPYCWLVLIFHLSVSPCVTTGRSEAHAPIHYINASHQTWCYSLLGGSYCRRELSVLRDEDIAERSNIKARLKPPREKVAVAANAFIDTAGTITLNNFSRHS